MFQWEKELTTFADAADRAALKIWGKHVRLHLFDCIKGDTILQAMVGSCGYRISMANVTLGDTRINSFLIRVTNALILFNVNCDPKKPLSWWGSR